MSWHPNSCSILGQKWPQSHLFLTRVPFRLQPSELEEKVAKLGAQKCQKLLVARLSHDAEQDG